MNLEIRELDGVKRVVDVSVQETVTEVSVSSVTNDIAVLEESIKQLSVRIEVLRKHLPQLEELEKQIS